MHSWGSQISRSEARHLERKSEERAEALAGTFTAQGVANSLSGAGGHVERADRGKRLPRECVRPPWVPFLEEDRCQLLPKKVYTTTGPKQTVRVHVSSSGQHEVD